MDVLGLVSLSSGSVTTLAAFGALGAALMVFIAGAALALRANRAAEESRASLELAEAKLRQSASVAEEVRALRAQVEDLSARYQDAISQTRLSASEPAGGRAAAPAEPERYAENREFGERETTRSVEDSDFRRSAFSTNRFDDDDEEPRRGFFSWMKRR